MYRISLIISELYNKYLPSAEKADIRLDLDIIDDQWTTDESDLQELKSDIDKHLKSALKRTPKGEIKISVRPHQIIISDSGTTLSKTACKLLTHGRVSVSSRVGFGTKVSFDFSKKESGKNPHKKA